MEQTNQNTKIDAIRINRDFYYTLALLQYESVNYIARSENDDIQIKRAKTIIEQVKEIIKTVSQTGNNPNTCLPPCYQDNMWAKCICPHIDSGIHGTHTDPTENGVLDG